jgi:hypothetical protein
MATDTTLTPDDLATLQRAKILLEHPGLAAKASNLLGAPIERGFAILPANWREKVAFATEKALTKALSVAVHTMRDGKGGPPQDRWHLLAVGVSGALGGAAGLAALPVELPVSTTLMLRSIADIARSEGADVRDVATSLACMEVFAMGGRTPGDDAANSAYFATRTMLARSVTEAAEFIAEKGLTEAGAPAIARLIATIASRFGITVSEKAAAQAVPLIGAAGGALVNTLFMDHFQNMAHGHFTVLRLERQYGAQTVRLAYESLR